MKKHIITAAFAATLFCSVASAQEFKGDITLGYSAFWDEMSVNRISGEGAFEFGLSDRASVQLDLGLFGFGASNAEGTNLVLHGIYDVNPQGSAGAFLGVDDVDGSSVNFYGVEYGQSFGTGGVEVYLARGKEAGVTGTVIGVEGKFALSEQFGLGVKLDNADFDGAVDVTRLGVKGIYALGQGSSVFAEVGSVRADAFGLTGSEAFVGVGLSIEMGGEEATFGRRGLLSLIPGL
ncbi:hypothetical protein [Paragemmobacter ruber]|uniref:Porin n=1 Tax=Paragemmobacter ruber TaxID=1985673 RepID=A0ABW9Y3U7_9RHOB|nr:hypothetical protein [Rhodobacter ruber]NBE06899.1 hypothetical protein [Rhodobacter ruber]